MQLHFCVEWCMCFFVYSQESNVYFIGKEVIFEIIHQQPVKQSKVTKITTTTKPIMRSKN